MYIKTGRQRNNLVVNSNVLFKNSIPYLHIGRDYFVTPCSGERASGAGAVRLAIADPVNPFVTSNSENRLQLSPQLQIYYQHRSRDKVEQILSTALVDLDLKS
jgi:hypothetical protein